MEAFEIYERRFARSSAGREANTRGKVAGTLIGTACGAERLQDGDNTFTIDGVPMLIHTVGQGTSFSVNEETEPAHIIAAIQYKKGDAEKPSMYLLYGLLLTDCQRCCPPPKKAARLTVSLGKLDDRRVQLGIASIPTRYLIAKTMDERDAKLDEINQMTSEELAEVIDENQAENPRVCTRASKPKRDNMKHNNKPPVALMTVRRADGGAMDFEQDLCTKILEVLGNALGYWGIALGEARTAVKQHGAETAFELDDGTTITVGQHVAFVEHIATTVDHCLRAFFANDDAAGDWYLRHHGALHEAALKHAREADFITDIDGAKTLLRKEEETTN